MNDLKIGKLSSNDEVIIYYVNFFKMQISNIKYIYITLFKFISNNYKKYKYILWKY